MLCLRGHQKRNQVWSEETQSSWRDETCPDWRAALAADSGEPRWRCPLGLQPAEFFALSASADFAVRSICCRRRPHFSPSFATVAETSISRPSICCGPSDGDGGPLDAACGIRGLSAPVRTGWTFSDELVEKASLDSDSFVARETRSSVDRADLCELALVERDSKSPWMDFGSKLI